MHLKKQLSLINNTIGASIIITQRIGWHGHTIYDEKLVGLAEPYTVDVGVYCANIDKPLRRLTCPVEDRWRACPELRMLGYEQLTSGLGLITARLGVGHPKAERTSAPSPSVMLPRR